MPITITVESSQARVLLFIDYTTETGTTTEVTISRGPSASGPWTEVRTVDLLSEQAYQYDTGAPLDTALWWRTVPDAGPILVEGPETIVSSDRVWVKDPMRPWADQGMVFCDDPMNATLCGVTPDDIVWAGWGDKDRTADAGLFPILNAERPADVWARRKSLNSSIAFFSRTLAAKTAVYELFTAGGPLFIQAPVVYGWDDAYAQPGDLNEAYISRDQRRPFRLWNAPVVLVDQPLGPIQGTECANWCAVQETFPTFAEMTAAGGTWGAVANGITVCGDPALDGYGEGGYGDGPYGD